jgi:hypothetical protein
VKAWAGREARPKSGELADAHEGFKETLCAEILVPQTGEALVFVEKIGIENVVFGVSGTGILLHARVVVAEVKRSVSAI